MLTKELFNWVKVAETKDFPDDGGGCVKFNGKQIAIFNFRSLGKWYATDNQCPHMKDMVIARGLIGDGNGEPKVACPMHKKTFSLESGKCLSGDEYELKTYSIKVENDRTLKFHKNIFTIL
jgi:nitrite reductase (NADH) small subunit